MFSTFTHRAADLIAGIYVGAVRQH